MKPELNSQSHASAPLTPVDRNRLLHLCRRLTGDPTAAEDIVQETLIVAWEKIAGLRDPARYSQWVEGIARNRCRQWLRGVRRHRAHLLEPIFDGHGEAVEPHARTAKPFDVEIELDRNELATLLDQALAQLPPLTRAVLLERYIHESPQAEIARGLGLSEGAVEQRIQRGKLTLRRVLTTDLREDAAAFGLITPADSWQGTRLWCPCCGRHRLQAYLPVEVGCAMILRCTTCGANFGTDMPGLFDGIPGYRTALSRFAKWYHPYFQQGLAQGVVPCANCGQPTRLHVTPEANLPPSLAELPPATPGTYGFWASCTRCQGWIYQSDLASIAFFVPAVQQFWRTHPRMNVLPERLVEIDGRSSLLISYQDITGQAQIDLLFDRTTLTFASVQQTVG